MTTQQVIAESGSHHGAELVKMSFPVTGMTCAACASSVESMLSATKGVEASGVNFATQTAWAEFDPSVTTRDDLRQAVQAIGYDLIMDAEDPMQAQADLQASHYQDIKGRFTWSALLTLPVFIIGMFFMDWEAGKWISMALSAVILFYFGRSFFVNAWRQAGYGKANMDTLVALSTGIAYAFSVFNTLFADFWHERGIHAHVYYESAVVIITFISLGKLLEERAKSSTSSAIKKLMGLQPKTVLALVEDEEVILPVAAVKPGDVLIVRPGEKVPVDGVVLNGRSFVDESMISGEPVPVEKSQDAELFAGTVNQKGSLRMRASKVGGETLLAGIIRMVQEAQGSKAPVQKLVDKIAGIFVPIVLGIAVLTFISWMIFGGENAFTYALLSSITVLVIACPCALGLATPTAIMVGVGKGAENNILIKDAESLELGYKVNAIILDKTGTITEGKPQVTDIHWEDVTDEQKRILLSMEVVSEHPLADAVAEHLRTKGFKTVHIDAFESLTGRGITASVNGTNYFVGNKSLVQEMSAGLGPKLEKVAVKWQEEAKTVIYFADDHRVYAAIAIADKVKEGSKRAIEKLQNRGIEVFMLTGDNNDTALAVARQVGLETSRVKAEVMPSEKAEFVKILQSQGKVVAMVGDGINDSHALAQANVSIAMGKGSDIAMDVAKMTLITSDLNAIPRALRLSKKTVIGVRQNLFWAFIYNLIGIPLAAGVLYPFNGFLLDPMIAGAAMAFSSVSVVANSLRLKLATL